MNQEKEASRREAIERIAELEAGLKFYGAHTWKCATGDQDGCNCGIRALLGEEPSS